MKRLVFFFAAAFVLGRILGARAMRCFLKSQGGYHVS